MGVIDILERDGDRLQIYLIFRYNFRRGGILIVGFSGIFYRVTEKHRKINVTLKVFTYLFSH